MLVKPTIVPSGRKSFPCTVVRILNKSSRVRGAGVREVEPADATFVTQCRDAGTATRKDGAVFLATV